MSDRPSSVSDVLGDPSQLVLAADLPPEIIEAVLRAYGFEQPFWADEILQDLAGDPPLRQEFAALLPELLAALRPSADPEMGLLNFARFAEAAISKATFFSTLRMDPDLIEVAIALFSTSQFFSDILIRDIRYFDWLRGAYSRGSLEDRNRMISELASETASLRTHEHRMSALRRFKRVEMLRIGFADIVRESSLQTITADLSNLADAELEVAYRCCLELLHREFGIPLEPGGRQAEFSILALGKLGGRELNYSSDIDLLFLYSAPGEVQPSPGAKRIGMTNQEFFDHLAEEVIRAISEPTEGGFVFRVDTRLRPDGQSGPLTRSLASCQTYYSQIARMWEHQAMIKARCAAGSQELGRRFLEEMLPLIYRKYLTFEEIQEIKTVKERMERQVAERGELATGVKVGTGGIRDIEYVVQFHQLLLGGEHPSIRSGNTLEALRGLGEAGILSAGEVASLDLAYYFLRKTEHRLQTLHQLKLHSLPTDERELKRLAARMNFQSGKGHSGAQAFLLEYRRHTETVRRIFERTFGHLFESGRSERHPEVNLVLSSEVTEGQIDMALGPFGFQNPAQAYQILSHLAEEDTVLLRSPRTREYLASLAPRLLEQIRETPAPVTVLTRLDRVVSSLGAKTMVYQWLSEEKEALPLLLRICSSGQLLVNLLETHPGMFDDLVDSLVIGERKDRPRLEEELGRLLHGAVSPPAILNGFRNAELLRIGTRDLLGRSETLETCRDLSNLAETVLRRVLDQCWEEMVKQFGTPVDGEGRPIPFAVLGLGKFGGQELNYFSDLDVLFGFEGEGQTSRGLYASDFFTRLAQHLLQTLGGTGSHAALFQLDARLRPMGSKGPLACATEFLRDYYWGGQAQTWERLALTKLRFAAGSPAFGQNLVAALHGWVYRHGLAEAELSEIRDMRQRLEASVTPANIKRGRGGIVDIEFLIQILCLRHGRECTRLRTPNTMDALHAIENLGLLPAPECRLLRDSYTFLRRVESRLRMVTNRAMDELPEAVGELDEMAYSMGWGKRGGQRLLDKIAKAREACRSLFNRVTLGV